MGGFHFADVQRSHTNSTDDDRHSHDSLRCARRIGPWTGSFLAPKADSLKAALVNETAMDQPQSSKAPKPFTNDTSNEGHVANVTNDNDHHKCISDGDKCNPKSKLGDKQCCQTFKKGIDIYCADYGHD